MVWGLNVALGRTALRGFARPPRLRTASHGLHVDPGSTPAKPHSHSHAPSLLQQMGNYPGDEDMVGASPDADGGRRAPHVGMFPAALRELRAQREDMSPSWKTR